jgi:V/A-type H+/Na+-transporting ATPase subunit D
MIKYQFNKIAMQQLRKQLKIRQEALPTLKNKESALRFSIKKEKEELAGFENIYLLKINEINSYSRLWAEFPDKIFFLKELVLDIKKTAGIKNPDIKTIEYETADFSSFQNPVWLNHGIKVLKEAAEIITKIEVIRKSIEILEYARKKTTQKVNLYEKVQIPDYSEAILKIKRYLEDVDNLDKASQKITKQKQASVEESEKEREFGN